VLAAPVALAGKEEAKEEPEAKVVLEDQVALGDQVALEAKVLAQEESWRNQRFQCTLSYRLRCIFHQIRQRDIRHNWICHPTYSNSISRPPVPVRC